MYKGRELKFAECETNLEPRAGKRVIFAWCLSCSQSSALINVGKKISRRQSDDYLTAEMTGFGLDPDWLTEQLRGPKAYL